MRGHLIKNKTISKENFKIKERIPESKNRNLTNQK